MKNTISFLPLAGLMLATLLPCSLFAKQEKERYDFIEQSFRAEELLRESTEVERER